MKRFGELLDALMRATGAYSRKMEQNELEVLTAARKDVENYFRERTQEKLPTCPVFPQGFPWYAVPQAGTPTKSPHSCPVCGGSGKLWTPGTTCQDTPCNACGSTGIVWG